MATFAGDSKPKLVHLISGKIKARARETLSEWESQSKSLNILLAGKAGTGKSTLVNAIIGEVVAVVGNDLDPMTGEVRCHKKDIDDVCVKVWDTPGLQDGTEKEKEYRESIKEKCTNIDLMIYCIQISETHLCDKNINAMIKLTNTLGKSIWVHSIIVLTFANEVVTFAKYNYSDEGERIKCYLGRLQAWRESIRKCMCSELKFPEEFVHQMSIMPAGIISRPELPDPDSDTGKSYWLSELWLKALFNTKLDAQPALIKINTYRMIEKPQEYEKKETRKQFLDDMALIFENKGAKFGMKFFGPIGKHIGKRIGFSYGVSESLYLFLRIAIDSNKIKEDDIVDTDEQ